MGRLEGFAKLPIFWSVPSLDLMEPETDMRARVRLTICGAVQGVGFRPFIYRLANELSLAGWVNNTAQGVAVELEGSRSSIEAFLLAIEPQKPPRSFIQSLETVWLAPAGADGFEIRESDPGGTKTAFVLPDIATCPDCLREILDPANRRHGYPFTNCTHCGPRFSIITALPYDRSNTSMRAFSMCEDCRREYEDPRDRRFHAQPNACPVCGPHLEAWDTAGRVLASHEEAFEAAAAAISDGAIVAVKGLGGFHLVVDARDAQAVERLRAMKHREEKPFAVMAPSLASVRNECVVSNMEERLLRSPEAPIVLLRRHASGSGLAPAVAPGNPFLGVMRPYTPLHHLLLARLQFPIVATSGNRSDEPICTDESEALERLAGIADFFLVHNRPIVRHVDDSIARVMLGRELVVRRARGYAPLPLQIKPAPQPTLAVGAHLKNTIALSAGKSVFISQHLGDLETAPAFAAFQEVIADFQRLYGTRPTVIATDLHPDYLSTKAATELAKQSGASLVPVQHHFAHILSCLAENELEPPALGVAWDGTGYGLDGTIWGGEFLSIMNQPGATGFERFAHLRTFPLPGGEAAAREPRRSALGLLYEIFGDDVFGMTEIPLLRAFSGPELSTLRTMLRRKINAPRTSSMGRLFDAVASLAGIRHHSAFEGQAAMELEWCAGCDPQIPDRTYPLEIGRSDSGPSLVIDWEPLIRVLLADTQACASAAQISATFHNTLAKLILEMARRSGHLKIVLSGGCFQNERLITQAVRRLSQQGFIPVWHQRVPCNDGGIALGQVAAVAMQILDPKENR